MDRRIEINLQLTGDVTSYASEARAAEADGFAMVTIPDHPGTGPSPSAVLGSLAFATSSVRLGAYVINAGVREPLDIASDIATLDQLSEGRAILGIGAGHTPAEWTMQSRPYPTPKQRVDRLIEVVEVTTRLLVGETVTFHGEHVHVDEAVLTEPRPVVERVPLLIGGGGQRVLELAGRMSDVVSYSGLGRTLDDGHRHEIRWSNDDVDRCIASVRRAALAASRPVPVIDILVQAIAVSDDRDEFLSTRFSGLGLSPEIIGRSPFLLVGSVEQQVDQVLTNHERWGISSYTVRDRKAGAELITALNR